MGGGAGLLQQLKNSQNRILKGILCMLQCCFACLERFLKMLTKNAYVEVGRDTDGERERERKTWVEERRRTVRPHYGKQRGFCVCWIALPLLIVLLCAAVCVCVCV
jgi:hypothetical protein